VAASRSTGPTRSESQVRCRGVTSERWTPWTVDYILAVAFPLLAVWIERQTDLRVAGIQVFDA